jgi:hypothetical protein
LRKNVICRRGRLLIIALLLGFGFCQTDGFQPAQAENAPQPVVWYKIDVELKLDDHRRPKLLEGREQLTWLNHSHDTIGELQFHLYLNAFKNEKSTFFRESGGQLRGDGFEPGQWGGIEITEMKIAGGEDLTPKIEFIHPDDDNIDDQSVIRVPLPRPLKPGEKITLDINFNARLPRVFARTGYWGPFAFVGQWFPKIGVWEKAGERRRPQSGWNCHQFHANTEFYADFGGYDVRMTVPSIYKGKIGATGVMKSETVNQNGTVSYHFTQENVHDFAWTVDTNYTIVSRRFNAEEQVGPAELEKYSKQLGLPPEQMRLKDVDVTLLIQTENRGQIDRHFKAAFNGLKYYGLWYGAYPYDTLTVVDPPFNAEGAGGMEYPTLISAGTTWWAGRDQNPEEVIVHEFGHQFWYGLVANNEFEDSWMDEGFNTYSEKKVLQIAYGPDVIPYRMGGAPLFYLPVALPHPFEDRIGTLRGGFEDPIMTLAWKYYDSASYSNNSYSRTGLALATLERYLGEDMMARVMREYQQRLRYRHPAPQDFFDVVQSVTGRDLRWFFDQYFRGTETLDYEIAEIVSEEAEGEIAESKDGVRVKDSVFENEIAVRRRGEAWFPVELLFRFKDGSRVKARPVGVIAGVVEYQLSWGPDGPRWFESWPLKDRWKKFGFRSSSELVAAQVDPDEKVLLDACLTNNSRALSSKATRGAMRWSMAAMFWAQTVLQFLSALG